MPPPGARLIEDSLLGHHRQVNGMFTSADANCTLHIAVTDICAYMQRNMRHGTSRFDARIP
jgi:hypothetical protein